MPTLDGGSGALPSAIFGVGAYRPTRTVNNEEVCRNLDTTPEWIVARSGIVTRRFAEEGETLVAMAAEASSKALAQAGIPPSNVDAAIVASMSYPSYAPTAAAAVAHQLGVSTAATFDVGAACAGFCHALAIGRDLVGAGSASFVLVVGSERMTDIVNPCDRGTAFLFGDGAGAVVIGRATVAGIGPVIWGTDTSHLDAIRQEGRYLHMAGQEVYRWAIRSVAPIAQRALDAAEVTADQLGAFIPHQANIRITEAIVSALDIPASVSIARTIADDGNTAAASIPMAIEHLLATGSCRGGDLALLLGFGAGLSYAAQVVRL